MKTLIGFLLMYSLSTGFFAQNSDWAYKNPNPQYDFYSIKFFGQNTGYISGYGGKLLKTTNGCLSFLTLSSGTSASLYSVYFSDPQTGFAAGDNSTIIYTSNGGIDWITRTAGLSSKAIKSIKFINATTGYAAGTSGLLMRTTNSGINWNVISPFTQLNLNSIYFVSQSKGFLCADSGKMYVTFDEGNSWSERNIAWQNLLCMEFVDSLKGFMGTGSEMSGSSSNLYRTDDGGNTWQDVPLYIVTRNWYSISFTDQNTGFVMGQDAPVLVTTNGGLLWLVYGAPPTATMRSSSAADTNVYICGTNGWISKINRGGSHTHYGGSKKSFSSISFLNENTGIVISEYERLTTTNGGENWVIKMIGGLNWHEGHSTYAIWTGYYPSGNLYLQYHTYIPTVIGEESIYCSSNYGMYWNFGFNTRGYINGIDEAEGVTYISTLSFPSGIYKSTGGAFSMVYNNTGNTLGKVTFANQNTGVVVGGGSVQGMMKTINGGKNWNFIATGNNKEIEGVKLLPSGIGYIAGDSSFFMKTTNYGTNWELMNTGISQYYQDMKFIDDNNGWLLYISGSWPNNYRLYFTKNGGNNFYPVTSLGNFNVKAFSFVNALTGYVAGDSGAVMKTTNGGLTFMSQNTGFVPDKFSLSQNYPNPFNPVTNIKFDIPKSGLVKITVYDLLGREVTTLVNQQMQPGSYNVDWDASNYPSGVYFYKLETESFAESKKMVLIK